MYSPVFSGMEHFHQHFIVLVDVIIVKLIFKIPHAENAKENVASSTYERKYSSYNNIAVGFNQQPSPKRLNLPHNFP